MTLLVFDHFSLIYGFRSAALLDRCGVDKRLTRRLVGRTSFSAVRISRPSGQAFTGVSTDLIGTPCTYTTGLASAFIQISTLKKDGFIQALKSSHDGLTSKYDVMAWYSEKNSKVLPLCKGLQWTLLGIGRCDCPLCWDTERWSHKLPASSIHRCLWKSKEGS